MTVRPGDGFAGRDFADTISFVGCCFSCSADLPLDRHTLRWSPVKLGGATEVQWCYSQNRTHLYHPSDLPGLQDRKDNTVLSTERYTFLEENRRRWKGRLEVSRSRC